MKLIILTALLCLSMGKVFALNGNETVCATHPLNTAYQVTQLIQDFSTSDSNAYLLSSQLIDDYNTNTPVALSKEDLGVCSQYEGQLSCCNKNITEFFDNLSALSVQNIMEEPTAISRLANLTSIVLTKSGCLLNATQVLEESDIFDNQDLTKFSELDDTVSQAKVDFAKTIARLNRGALCSMCMGISDYNGYLVNNQLQVKQASVTAFLADQLAAYQAYVASAEDSTNVNLAIDEAVDSFTTGTSCAATAVAAIKSEVKTIYARYKTSNKDASNNLICSGLVLFGNRDNCESLLDGDQGIEDDAETYNTARFLAMDTNDVAASSTGGIDSYLIGDADKYITADGEFNIPFQYELQNSTSTEKFDSITSVSILKAISLSALFAAFFI